MIHMVYLSFHGHHEMFENGRELNVLYDACGRGIFWWVVTECDMLMHFCPTSCYFDAYSGLSIIPVLRFNRDEGLVFLPSFEKY